MLRKIPLAAGKIIILLAFLNAFAWSVYYVHIGGEKFGFLTSFIRDFTQFPSLVLTVYKEIVAPERLLRVDEHFEEINTLDYDVFALNASFDQGRWVNRLSNLRTDSTIFEWYLSEQDYFYTDRRFDHSDPRTSIILEDTSLIMFNDESFNLFRLNAQSEIVWHNKEHQFHHAIHQDHDGDIWTCTRAQVKYLHSMVYWDNYLTKIDVNTGETLFHKSLTKIFLDNGFGHLIHGYGNSLGKNGADPFHLNEIEPVLEDGIYWKKGDLLISMRHRSLVLLYRPSSNKILHVIQGEFNNQHDVDIVSDSTLIIFNNNYSSLREDNYINVDDLSEYHKDIAQELADSLLPNPTFNLVSQVVVYNFRDSSFSPLYPSQFEDNEIFTMTQGLQHLMPNGDLFVEEWEDGKVYILRENKTILRKYINKPRNGLVEYPHWVRIYENLDFLK